MATPSIFENATWTNTIGASELITVWKDPEFDAKQRAFYYVQRHRNPNPALDRVRRERIRSEAAPGTRMTVTERAYTSPIL